VLILLWWLQIRYGIAVKLTKMIKNIGTLICNFQPFDDSSGVPDPLFRLRIQIRIQDAN
jgi:hypothetical protein